MEWVEFPFYLKEKTQVNTFRCQLRGCFLHTGLRLLCGGRWLGWSGQMLTSGFK